MKLIYMTDIHLDHCDMDTVSKFESDLNATSSSSDVLLVGGDLGNSENLISVLTLLSKVWSRNVYFVLGNHDYYGSGFMSTDIRATAFTKRHENSHMIYLGQTDGIFQLDMDTCLIGCNGWGDATEGDYWNTNVVLNDVKYIDDLKGKSAQDIYMEMYYQGRKSAEQLQLTLSNPAIDIYNNIIVLTHVPPYLDAAWHEGKLSSPNYSPFFVCGQVGEVLSKFMEDRGNVNMTVLCGHTHSMGACTMGRHHNINVVTTGAIYGEPKFITMDSI